MKQVVSYQRCNALVVPIEIRWSETERVMGAAVREQGRQGGGWGEWEIVMSVYCRSVERYVSSPASSVDLRGS